MKDNNKKLVVYFTYTNNTKMIAEIIKKELNCDILEIKPQKEYSNDYDVVVAEEQNNSNINKTPEIKKIDINIEDYTEIIIGTPVWWYTMAPPIRTFLVKNNLKGKNIIPFATNAGWLGSTFKDINNLCPDATVKKEMNIVFTGNHKENVLVTSKDKINNWINTLK